MMPDMMLPQERDLLDRMRLKIAQRFKRGDYDAPKVKSFTVEVTTDASKQWANGVVIHGYKLHAEMEDGQILDAEGIGY